MRSHLVLFTTFSVLASACSSGKKDGGADSPPVAPAGASITAAPRMSSIAVSWAGGFDDETPADALEYGLYLSDTDDIVDLSQIDANGVPVGTFGAGVFSATAAPLSLETQYWFNVVVRDEAGNRTPYAPASASTAGSCSEPIECPVPASGITICGQIVEAGSNDAIVAEFPTGEVCAATAAGPCALRMQVYDALELSMNPAGAVALGADVVVDDCGRFRASNVPAPSFGFVALTVDDAPGSGDLFRVTAVSVEDTPSAQTGITAYATAAAMDEAWSASAGLVGDTFAERGVVALVFGHQGVPRSGVEARRGGASVPDDDFYFSDTDDARTTVDAGLALTGSNGTALFLDSSSPLSHTGSGNEPGSCAWEDVIVGSPAGVVWFQAVEAELAGEPCP